MSTPFSALGAVWTFLETGSYVLWAILLASLVLWSLIIERAWYLRRVYPERVRSWREEWGQRQERSSWCARRIREGMISRAGIELGHSLSLIKTLIALCPLLGLLGTVTGMIEVFDVLAVTGTGNARAMASGVSRATIPTMAGMVVALSGIYFSARLQQQVRQQSQRLADSLRFDEEFSHENP
ncbi:MotA/TolQ/ExbB proton channel family protein [Desulfuromonas sp. AOP6]|uniref:MotA/TolQ/ExbB proton channel family protein n=1 Tax=Desulfuromonas sp. AOP6 TaxID=1566351 RepID=UPI00127F3E05|nr:MotA/TolQ/ExbB proton channel family protein [Desulfuromonas sp. AOP6]BCA79043.1 TonB2 energy transduction system inner membranecomponent ExbB [Desulfuromonas sp. AOP6]